VPSQAIQANQRRQNKSSRRTGYQLHAQKKKEANFSNQEIDFFPNLRLFSIREVGTVIPFHIFRKKLFVFDGFAIPRR
jgi:hypothetical protein